MATLKEFEDALRQSGMTSALAILDGLRQRDRQTRRAAPARRVTGRKMTPDLAHRILNLHGTTTMTQQEIAFQLGVNQGRVNEVIKRGKWLDGNPHSPEARARDAALARVKPATRPPRKPKDVLARRAVTAEAVRPAPRPSAATTSAPGGQLSFGNL